MEVEYKKLSDYELIKMLKKQEKLDNILFENSKKEFEKYKKMTKNKIVFSFLNGCISSLEPAFFRSKIAQEIQNELENRNFLKKVKLCK